jgi:hypothetical protein
VTLLTEKLDPIFSHGAHAADIKPFLGARRDRFSRNLPIAGCVSTTRLRWRLRRAASLSGAVLN